MTQTIIVTWWAWFIWSNFLNTYVLKYPEIKWINIDALTYAGKIENIDQAIQDANNYHFEQVDIRDVDTLRAVYKKYQPTDIIHFAAESHVDNSIANPRIFVETNVLGTQNLLDLHRECGLRRFHHISTDEVYGDLPNGWFFTESTPLNPSSPYSASKAASDMLVYAYGRTFGVDFTMSRCSNNYGPHQDNEKLIPHFISLLQQDKPVTVYGDGSNVRDWLYVGDHCDALWQIFTQAESWSIYNIWGNNEYTNLEITHILLEQMDKDESYISFIKDRAGHDVRYAIDATKIKNDLWREPRARFEEWIIDTVNFYLNQKSN